VTDDNRQVGFSHRGGVLGAAESVSAAWAQTRAGSVGGVYTCIDAKGRKLTADRPIPECTDREQKILNPSGTVKAKVGPSLDGSRARRP
jgi:hypothetical protein